MDRLRSVEGVALCGSVIASASGFGFDGGSHRLDNELVVDLGTRCPRSSGTPSGSRRRGARGHGGAPEVTVGVIDTGVDATHPDIDGNIDGSRSVSCVSGAPNQDPAAWNDDSGHGTNVAGSSRPRRTARGSSASPRA